MEPCIAVTASTVCAEGGQHVQDQVVRVLQKVHVLLMHILYVIGEIKPITPSTLDLMAANLSLLHDVLLHPMVMENLQATFPFHLTVWPDVA